MESKRLSLARYPTALVMMQFSPQLPLPTVDKGKDYLHAITILGFLIMTLVLCILFKVHKAGGKIVNFLFLLDPWQIILSFTHNLLATPVYIL